MASCSNQRILTFKAGAAIAKGKAVKIGAANDTVLPGAANTDGLIGIAQNAALSIGDLVEVAIQGGGAKGLAKEAITAGKLLTSNADGSLEQTNASGDRVIAVAMEGAAAGDLFAVEVVICTADGADA